MPAVTAMPRTGFTRAMALIHRLHRWLGTSLALLMALWFASGAMMTFVDYPAYTDAERLVEDLPLMAAAAELPPALSHWLRNGGLAGGHARLAMLEGEPRWLLQGGSGYLALRTQAPWDVTVLDERRARAAAEKAHGPCRGETEIIEAPDQWTVGRSQPGSYPLQRLACDDATGTQIYVSLRSGEVVQQSTRAERALAWLGPIPHWIYPAVLRRERELWRDVVLWMSALGCAVTLTGLGAGTHAALRRRRLAPRPQRQVYLRWHQRLGLVFGMFAFAWVFSGALSLEPFHWASPASEPARAWSQLSESPPLPLQLTAAIEHCRAQLPALREIELVAFGKLHVLCSDARAQTRIVDLEDPSLTPRKRLADAQLMSLAGAIGAEHTLASAPDDYYYPTHRRPIALPYARFTLSDRLHTVLYVDPARAELIDQIDDKRRLERWLYHGLHSWDVPVLYGQPLLWRSVVIGAMLIGFALAVLGLMIFTRRQRRMRR